MRVELTAGNYRVTVTRMESGQGCVIVEEGGAITGQELFEPADFNKTALSKWFKTVGVNAEAGLLADVLNALRTG